MPKELVPLFRSQDILTSEMLLALKDHAINFENNLYARYSDGVLSGCKLSFTNEEIILNPGLVRNQGNLYQISDPLRVSYDSTNRLSVCKLRFAPDEVNASNIIRSYDLLITELEDEQENDLELCRFKLQSGFRLRAEYVNFEDRITGYDTVNIVHCPFAAYGQSTLAPEILMAFAAEAMECQISEQIDYVFHMAVLSTWGKITKEALMIYIACRLKTERIDLTNEQMFRHLVDILEEIKRSGSRDILTQPKKRRVVLVE